MVRARPQIIGALLIVLLGTSQAIAAVCESFCPAHDKAAVEVASHHGLHHAAAAPADDAAPQQPTRIAMRLAACCATPDVPGQTLTTTRTSSLREGIAAASIGTPALAPKLADTLLNIDVDFPSGPSSRAPAILILRI